MMSNDSPGFRLWKILHQPNWRWELIAAPAILALANPQNYVSTLPRFNFFHFAFTAIMTLTFVIFAATALYQRRRNDSRVSTVAYEANFALKILLISTVPAILFVGFCFYGIHINKTRKELSSSQLAKTNTITANRFPKPDPGNNQIVAICFSNDSKSIYVADYFGVVRRSLTDGTVQWAREFKSIARETTPKIDRARTMMELPSGPLHFHVEFDSGRSVSCDARAQHGRFNVSYNFGGLEAINRLAPISDDSALGLMHFVERVRPIAGPSQNVRLPKNLPLERVLDIDAKTFENGFVLAISTREALLIYDSSGEKLMEIAKYDDAFRADRVRLSENGRFVIGQSNHRFYVWSIEQNRLLAKSLPIGYDVVDFRCSDKAPTITCIANSRRTKSGCDFGHILTWRPELDGNLDRPTRKWEMKDLGLTTEVDSPFAFSTDAKYFVTIDELELVWVDLQTNRQRRFETKFDDRSIALSQKSWNEVER